MNHLASKFLLPSKLYYGEDLCQQIHENDSSMWAIKIDIDISWGLASVCWELRQLTHDKKPYLLAHVCVFVCVCLEVLANDTRALFSMWKIMDLSLQVEIKSKDLSFPLCFCFFSSPFRTIPSSIKTQIHITIVNIWSHSLGQIKEGKNKAKIKSRGKINFIGCFSHAILYANTIKHSYNKNIVII